LACSALARAASTARRAAAAAAAAASWSGVGPNGSNPAEVYHWVTAALVRSSYVPSTGPGSNLSRLSPCSSWRTSSPDIPGTRSRYAGIVPWRTNTGRPEAVSMTPPSRSWVFRKGSVVINPAFAFKADGTIEIGWGNPNRAVPRVTMLELSTRSSTGTRIGDGVGGAARAATSAGDSIRKLATQPPTARRAANPRTPKRTRVRCISIIQGPDAVLCHAHLSTRETHSGFGSQACSSATALAHEA